MLESLEKDMRMAHMTQIPKKYFVQSVLQAGCFAVIFAIAVFLLRHALTLPIPFLYDIPEWILYVFFCGLIPAGAFLLSYFTPKLKASSRKSKINLDLPYAITYMQALSTTITLYEIFRSVYEAKDLYGEVSAECGMIVRDVELFGQDLITAIENTMEVTPSENFKELLNDLLLVHRSGGDLRGFFNAKSESYREVSKNEMESLLEFLEMIAEVYVTALVAGPIAIIIMVVAQNISGQNTIGNLMPLMYIGLPLGALVLIFILYVLLPPNNLVISKKEIRDSEYSSEIIRVQGLAKDPEFEKKINRRKRMLKINDILHHPVKAYISSYIPAGILGGVLVVVVILLWYFGIIEKGFPYYTIEVTICFVLMVAVLPLAVAYEIRNRYVKSVEKQLPEVLREISDMRDVGMTLQGAINMISGHKRGVLSTEIRMVSEEVKYGASLSSALVRMEERVGLTTVKRAISLLVRASEVTDYIREILAIAIADLEHYLKMKNKRFNVSFVYLAIIYLSVGIFLFAAYEMNVAFINSFSSFNIAINTGNSAEQMFIIGIILAFFSGIMAGQLSANTILSGLKHSIVMLAMTIVTFVILVGVR